MENQQSAYAKTKALISFAVTAKLISAFGFATRIVQFLYFLNPKFPASSHLLCLYMPVRVGPARKPHCWFSHEMAQIFQIKLGLYPKTWSPPAVRLPVPSCSPVRLHQLNQPAPPQGQHARSTLLVDGRGTKFTKSGADT